MFKELELNRQIFQVDDLHIPTYDDLVEIIEAQYDLNFWWDDAFASEESAMHALGYLLAANTAFIFIFGILLCVTLWLMYTKDIDDLFTKYSLRLLSGALSIRVFMCTLASRHTERDYLENQRTFDQQVYFELPYFPFLIAIAAILFSFEEFY